MSIRSAIQHAAAMVDLFGVSDMFPKYFDINTSYKGSSTKKGNNPKAIKARRKKNKNKKTHRR